MGDRAPSSLSPRRAIAEALVALTGIGLIVLAIGLTQSWFDHHLLPSFYLMRRWYVFLESSSRVALALLGVFLLLVARPRIGRLAARTPVCPDSRSDRRRSCDWRRPTRCELVASVYGVAARAHRAVAASGSATRLDVRPEPRGPQDRRRDERSPSPSTPPAIACAASTSPSIPHCPR